MQGTMWLQRSGPYIVRQTPPPKLSINTWQLPHGPCSVPVPLVCHRENKLYGICASRLTQGREEELSSGDWMNAHWYKAAWRWTREQDNELGRKEGWRTPGTLLAGAEALDWGQWWSSSAQCLLVCASLSLFQFRTDRASAKMLPASSVVQGRKMETTDKNSGKSGSDLVQGESCSPGGQCSVGQASSTPWMKRSYAWSAQGPCSRQVVGLETSKGPSAQVLWWFELISELPRADLAAFSSSDV